MAGVPWAEGASNETVGSASSGPDLQHSLFAVTYSVVFVLGLVGNALALYLLSCRVQHVGQSYLYMLNLALVDTLFVCVLPLEIYSHLNLNSWIFGDVACRVTGTLFYLTIHLSMAFFTCLCVDGYVVVLQPLTYIQLRTSHCLLVAMTLWVVALGVTIPLVLGHPLHHEGEKNITACLETFSTSSWPQPMLPYSILDMVWGAVVPLSLILVAFPLMARSISRVKRGISRRKALSTIYLILAICVLCFLPYHLTHLLHFLVNIQVIQDESFTIWIYSMRRVTVALVSLSCCLNPLLYYHTSSSKPWHCNLRLRFRSKKVFTICDQKFGEPSCDYKLQQSRGSKTRGDGINCCAPKPRGF
ncbi:lysophosphatidic acid receptor 6-like protein [Willisornis vidua]|uniref:Lysophosphatidic acid receptor 6-like protein n=1 Tax=Willisornis vidua TaxID=1566151 RepID=A0ABQ9DM69_9PASS|nr:lysophosphatidic acid receptor 6-like protein [Willisornis vidua]